MMPETSSNSIPKADTAVPATDPLVGVLAALRNYREGADRGTLVPLDEAVQAADRDPGQRRALEKTLLKWLGGDLPPLAQDFLCAKLGLIGGAASVAFLSRLLPLAPSIAYAARAALEAIGSPAAARALRGTVERSEAAPDPGFVRALGHLRDPRSVTLLTRLAAHPDPAVTAAARAALGNIASPKAAEALRTLLEKTGGSNVLCDACLVCADRLRAEGEPKAADALMDALKRAPTLPAHLRRALTPEPAKAKAD